MRKLCYIKGYNVINIRPCLHVNNKTRKKIKVCIHTSSAWLLNTNNNNNNNNLYFVLETWDITVHLITYIVIQLHKNNNS